MTDDEVAERIEKALTPEWPKEFAYAAHRAHSFELVVPLPDGTASYIAVPANAELVMVWASGNYNIVVGGT